MSKSVEPERWYMRDAVVAEINEDERVQTGQCYDLCQLILLQINSS